jgi:hypothetical protein
MAPGDQRSTNPVRTVPSRSASESMGGAPAAGPAPPRAGALDAAARAARAAGAGRRTPASTGSGSSSPSTASRRPRGGR